MKTSCERRREQRLHYNWPLTFSEGLSHKLYRGQMLDISSGGGSFTCQTHEKCPSDGQYLMVHFSVPRPGVGMEKYVRCANVVRIENLDSMFNRVSVKFEQPLEFKPAKIVRTPAIKADLAGVF